MDLAKCYGASVVGVVTSEMLVGGPPSADLSYVLPNAQSAISFAVPLDQNYIESWFNKQSHYVCGGFAGLHKSGKWSTWSPARFPIPEKDEEFYPALVNAVGPFLKRSRPALNVFNVLMPGDKVELTCGNCQLICHPDKEIRQKRYKLLTESGVIVENPDGSREAVSPVEAKKHLAGMDPATRALYEDT